MNSMTKNEITELVAKILFIEDPTSIDPSKSLFREYRMSSLDFVDFTFELQSRCGKELSLHDLWPVNSMLTDPEYFADGNWTPAGKQRLKEIFRGFPLPEKLEVGNL